MRGTRVHPLAFLVCAAHALAANATLDLAALAPTYLADVPRLKALKQEHGKPTPKAAIGVFADYGVWSGSARALVDAVRGAGHRCAC